MFIPVPETFCQASTGSGTGEILESFLEMISTKVDLPAPTLPSRTIVYGIFFSANTVLKKNENQLI